MFTTERTEGTETSPCSPSASLMSPSGCATSSSSSTSAPWRRGTTRTNDVHHREDGGDGDVSVLSVRIVNEPERVRDIVVEFHERAVEARNDEDE